MRLAQSTWLITGATSGIGLALTRALARRGARFIAWGRDEAMLARLRDDDACVAARRVDLRDAKGLREAAEALLEVAPNLNGVLHGAGIQHARAFDDEALGESAIEEELTTNLRAPIVLTRLLLPRLRTQPEAAVVFITSALAWAPKRDAAVYAASKAGLRQFADALRLQMRGGSLRVIEAVPPLVDTPMTAGRGSGKISAEACAEAIARGIAAGRERIWVGKVWVMAGVMRVAPGVGRWVMGRG